jgi:hypothetical protein
MGGTCGTCVKKERYMLGLMGKPEGKRPLGRSRRRLEDIIKMVVQGIGYGRGLY